MEEGEEEEGKEEGVEGEEEEPAGKGMQVYEEMEYEEVVREQRRS